MRLCPLSVLIPSVLLAQSPDAAWKERILNTRKAKDIEFRTGKTSPLAGIQRLTIETGKGVGLRLRSDGLELSAEETAVTVRQEDGQWVWISDAGEKSMAGGAVFTLGRFHVQGQLSADRATLLVFDPEKPQMKAFKGLRYFPPARPFAVSATVEPVAATDPITLTTTRNLKKPFTPFARVHFRLEGKAHSLTAYRSPGDDTMFIPFTDATTGKATYSVGRFLEIPVPKERVFTMDFNGAFNPLCNYSAIWNCPLPPEENALRVAVRAGEKAYPSH